MEETRKPRTGRQASEISWGNITTENAYDVDGSLRANQGVSLDGLDLFQGYMKVRKSVQRFPGAAPGFGTSGTMPTGTVLNTSSWVVDGVEYIILQYSNGFWYRRLDTSTDNWLQIEDYNFNTNTSLGNMVSSSTPCTFTRAADKLYVFQSVGNSIIERVGPFGTGNVYFLRRRDVGMGRPAITGFTNTTMTTEQEAGVYGYAVEYVYRKEIGTPAEADFLASTPQRYMLSQSTPKLFKQTIPAGSSLAIQFATFDTPADDLWTHVKLYRTKKLNQDSVTDEVFGNENELYLIQRHARASITNTFDYDTLNDSQLPVIPLGAETVLYPDMDQRPLPDGNIGVYHANRIWMTDVPDDITGGTELFYTSATAWKYTEQFSDISRYPCNPGDGQAITSIVSFEEDLIVFKQAQTGRVPSGDPAVRYDKLNGSIGIVDKAFYVPRLGIVGLVNDQADVMVFGYDLQWRTDVGGLPFSRPVRGVFYSPGSTLTGVTYFEGKLLLSVGTKIWAFHVSEGLGWSHYNMNYLSVGTDVTTIFTNTLGDRCIFMMGNLVSLYEFGERGATEHSGVQTPWSFQTSGFQVEGGRGFIEQRYLSIMAKLLHDATVSVAYTGHDNELKSNESFVLAPGDVNPSGNGVLAEYQYYATHKYPERTRIYADRLFYTVKGTGYTEVMDVRLYCFTQTGMRPGWASTKSTQDNDNGIIADLSAGQLHWQTRDDMSQDKMNPQDKSKPFQDISFIVMRAP
tara:strand:+ start:8798 stop:11020 length:2223 start_codon:yes stop_codon:yes gene_type:complete